MTATTMDPVRVNGEARHAAVAAAREAAAAGVPLTGKALAARFGMSDRWGRDRIAEARQDRHPVPVAATVAERRESGEQQVTVVEPVAEPTVVQDASRQRRPWYDTAVVLVVAAVAAAASYGHMRSVAEMAGEPGWITWLFPVSVDGLVLAALRRGEQGRAWLALGLAVSVAANVLAAFPALVADLGPVVSAWPPLALYGTHRLLHR